MIKQEDQVVPDLADVEAGVAWFRGVIDRQLPDGVIEIRWLPGLAAYAFLWADGVSKLGWTVWLRDPVERLSQAIVMRVRAQPPMFGRKRCMHRNAS